MTGGGTISKWQYKRKVGTAGFDANWTDISNSGSTSLSHTFGGLTDGTNYQYRVRAVNATGHSADSEDSDAVQPGAATLTVSSVEVTTATLTIGNYAHANGWWYKHTVPSTGTCSAKQTAADASLSLSGNTDYTFKAYSDSGCTSELASKTLLTKPAQPDKPAAVRAGSGKLTVTSSVTGGGTISKWQYKRKVGTAGFDANWTDISNSGSTSLSHTFGSLTDGTNYQYRVRAVNATGHSADSEDSDAVQPGAATLTVSSVEVTTATLTIGNYAHANGWWYKHTVPSTGTCSAKQTAADASLSLSGNTDYTFKAYSDSGCTSELASKTLLTKPAQPDKPAAVRAGSGKLTVTSSVTGGGTISKWQYKRKVGTAGFDANWTDISNSGSTSLSHTFGSLTDGTNYQYRVRAVNATGHSADSEDSDAVQPGAATLTVSSVEVTTATLTIGNYAHANGWWYKHTVPSTGTCSAKQTAADASLSLSGNTDYTFKAYSDSGCTSELASKTLLTKPAQPDKPAAVRAGSGKLTVTSSVTGGGTISKWQYKRKVGTAGFDANWTDISNSGSTSLSHTFGSLTDGTNYQYRVRAVNATGHSADSEDSDAVQPGAATLTVSSVEVTTATLTIGNYAHANGWWYKHTVPSTGTCSAKQTAADASLSLSGNTDYTFKAYSDSGCTSELASKTLLTKPAQPDKPAAVRAGSGKLTVTSSVTGGGTISKWQYKRKVGTAGFDANWTDISNSGSTSLSHTFGSLTDGTNYQYRVRAVNATGHSADSEDSDAVQPGAATLTVSSVEVTTATLTIGNYAHANGWWYKHTVPSTGTCSAKQTAADASLSLSGNTDYTFKAYSDSGCTSELASKTLLTKPAQPDKPAAVRAGSGKLTVTSSVTGGGTISKWQYKRKVGTAGFDANWTDISNSGSTSLSHTFGSLTDGTNYQYRVRAVNATGHSADSEDSDAVQPGAATLTVSSVEVTTATLTIGNYAHANGWWYKHTVPSTGTCSAKQTAADASLSLSGNTDYTFKAYSDSGCTSELASKTLLTKPAQPDKPAAVRAGSGKLTVTSSVTGGGTISKWQYKRKVGTAGFDANWTDISNSGSTSLSHTFGSLTDGTNYQYRVRAVNATGHSADSEDSDAVQPGAATLTVSSVEVTTATLTIGNYAHANGWWYKHTVPSTGTCSAKQTAADASLSLSGNTDYTFKAYSDSGCTSELASKTLLTKPAQPDKPAAVRAGSGKLTVTSSVTGGGTISKWQYKRKVGTAGFDANWTDISNSGSTSLSHTFGSLTDGTNYQYRVRAVNATGHSADSEDSDAVQPGAATLTVSSVEVTTATLTIGNYAHANGWWYKHTVPSTGTCSAKQTAADASLSLSGNTDYTFKAYSDSGCTSELASKTLLTKPAQPDKPAAVRAGSGKLTVTSSVTGGGTISKWQYKRKVGTAGFDANWTDISNSGSTSLSHTFTGLTDGTNYQYRVRAVNATGHSADSEDSDAVQPGAATLTVSSVEVTTATLTIGNYAHANGWWYKHTVPSTGTCSAKQTAADASLSLSGNTDYTFKAYSDSGCTSELASKTLLTKPAQPDKPAAVRAGSGKLTVTSSVTGGGTISKWQYKRKVGTAGFDANWTDISNSGSTSLSHTFTGLTDGTNYQYRVRAVNATGHSADSEDSDAVQPGAATLTVSSVEVTTATLTIGNYAHANGWWYKHTVPSTGTCSAKQTAADASLSLSGNTDYTFKAYSDSGCTSELASKTLLTKPAQPDKPAAVRAGSGKLTVTSSVTGGGTISKWQYKRKVGTAGFDANWTDISNSGSTSLSHTFGSLTDGTNYQYRVRAVNATGHSADSEDSDAVQPGAATLTVSSVEVTTATLTIGNYAHANGWWYKHTVPSTGTCSAKQTAADASLSLSGNTDYTFKAYSDSGCTSELASKTLLTKPAQPDKPAAVRAGSGKLTVTSSVTGGGTISKWQYKRKVGTAGFDANWTDISNSGSTSLSHTFGSLTDGTNYQYRVRAVNATGHSADSEDSDAVQPGAATLTVSSVEVTTATLTIGNWPGSWYYKANAAPDNSCKGPVSSGTSDKDLTGLSGNTDYTYKAYSDSGCSTELASEDLLTKPGKPTGVSASAGAGSGKLTLAATVSGSGTLTKWQYKQKSGGNYRSWQDISETSTSLNHTFTGLTDSADYQFKVRAWNGSGESVESDESTAVAPVAATLAASSVEADSATLTISDYTAAWYYKANAAPDNSCKGPVSGGTATKNLTSLSGNTSYTYKAYADGNCSTELTTAATAAEFLTKPGQPDPLGVTTNIGGDKLRLDSSVTGGGTISRWEYQQKASTDTDFGAWTDISSTSTALDYTVEGLSSDTEYKFKVRAVNATGTGAESGESEAVRPAAAPRTSPGTGGGGGGGGGGSADTEPSFGSQTIADLTWHQGLVIEPLVLPTPRRGGNTPFTYKLEPALPPGVDFDRNTRTLSGLPEAPLEPTLYTYTVTDADDDTATLEFLLTVDAAEPLDLRPTFDTDQRMADDGKLIGRVPDDLQKSASAAGSASASIADQSYVQNTAIEPLPLPEASGGDGPLSYALEPALPQGMAFDDSTRMMSGTPMMAQAPTRYTYTATDVDGDTASLAFTMTVAADLHPEFGADASIADLSWEQGELIDPLTLPAATGGDKPLTYALEPTLPPGLHFDATTRVLSGTPEAKMAAERYTYMVTDADGDTASLAFRLAATAPAIALAERAILTDSLASQGRAILGSARRALDGRFRDTDRAADAAGLKTILSSWQNRLTAAATGTPATATGTGATASALPGESTGVRATALTPSIRAHPGIDTPGTDTSAHPGTPAAASAPATLPAEINLTSAYGAPNAGPVDGTPAATLPGTFGLSSLSGACGTQAPPDPTWPTPADSRVDNGWDDGACNGTPGLRLSDWLWGRRYALRLNGLFGKEEEDNETRRGPDWTLWSAGDQRHVEGTPGDNHYQTDWRSLHLGLDARFNADWLAGVVVSRGWGETGYGFNGPGATGTGELETEVWTALPYLHGRLANGLEVWGLAGGGWGEVSAIRSQGEANALSNHETGAEEDSNLTLWLARAGARAVRYWLGAT